MHWIIYGATGYTGRLMAAEAARRGMKPVLAGRSPDALREIAEPLGLDWQPFALDDPRQLRTAIGGAGLVLHCAGPFSATAQPMIEACLAAGAHYLDITGEIDVFALAHSMAGAARRADVALVPGVGFDVVPSDCLAASLVESLPAAIRLQLGFEATGGPSPGTAKTMLEGFRSGGRVRKDGALVTVPPGWKTRRIPFAHAERTGVTIPWGDVFTAFITTGVPDIEVYISMPPSAIAWLRRLRWVQPLLGYGFVQRVLKNRVDRVLQGPSEQTRHESYCELWGEASSADGRTVSATMTTPNGYELTVSAALGIVGHLLENSVEGGYYTPSLLMGSAYARSLPGVTFRQTC